MKGKRVVLDRQHMIKMVRSPDFYLALPEMVFLKPSADEATQAAKQSDKCGSCGDEWTHMRGVIDAVFAKLKELKADPESDALQRLRKWLEERKGYPITKAVIYYRRSARKGRIAKFEF